MAGKGAKRSRRQISDRTATSSDQSIQSFQGLEENLLIEILSRIPTARYAVRCKLVCKRWCSLISTPYFIKSFIDIHNQYHDSDNYSDVDAMYQKPFGLLLTHVHHLRDSELNFTLTMFSKNPSFNFHAFSLARYLPEKQQFIIVVASCKDLILCETGMRNTKKSYFLCNPFTKQWVALPSPSPITENICSLSTFGLVCEPYCGRSINGGGNAINPLYRYRIVRFCYGWAHGPANLIAVETYHSETGQWVESDSLSEVREDKIHSNIVAYNGKLCWVGAGCKFLVTYDPFNMGQRRHISLLHDANFNQPNDEEVSLQVGVSEGVLRIMRTGNEYEDGIFRGRHFSVWDVEEEVMSGDYSNERRFEFKTRSVGCLPCLVYFVDEIATHPTNKDVVYFYSKHGYNFVEYNMESGEFKVGGRFNYWKQGPNSRNQYKIFPLVLPWWPTPVLNHPPPKFVSHSSQS